MGNSSRDLGRCWPQALETAQFFVKAGIHALDFRFLIANEAFLHSHAVVVVFKLTYLFRPEPFRRF